MYAWVCKSIALIAKWLTSQSAKNLKFSKRIGTTVDQLNSAETN